MTNKTPCEEIVWQIIPAIRSELAKELINEFGLSQKETAEKLGLTEAAVSRYKSGKRADSELIINGTQTEINKSVKKIIKGDKKTVVSEICRICKYLQNKGIISTDNEC
jgi:predicted transcriptional regulator